MRWRKKKNGRKWRKKRKRRKQLKRIGRQLLPQVHQFTRWLCRWTDTTHNGKQYLPIPPLTKEEEEKAKKEKEEAENESAGKVCSAVPFLFENYDVYFC
jgi:hypothetical protein